MTLTLFVFALVAMNPGRPGIQSQTVLPPQYATQEQVTAWLAHEKNSRIMVATDPREAPIRLRRQIPKSWIDRSAKERSEFKGIANPGEFYVFQVSIFNNGRDPIVIHTVEFTGDLIGKENKENILKAVRPDGVIVKPDRPLLPCDRTYLDASQHKLSPFMASTFTDHESVRTTYVFAFPRPKGERTTTFHLSEFGIKSGAYVLNQVTRVGKHYDINDEIPIKIGNESFCYLMIAPDTRSGIHFLGDLLKFVSTGKKRIVSIVDGADGLTAKIAFAKGEMKTYIEVASTHELAATSAKGSAKMVFDNVPGRTAFEVSPKPGTTSAEITFKVIK